MIIPNLSDYARCHAEMGASPGVELIRKVRPIAPSTYHDRVAKRWDPARLLVWGRLDQALKFEIMRVFAENVGV